MGTKHWIVIWSSKMRQKTINHEQRRSYISALSIFDGSRQCIFRPERTNPYNIPNLAKQYFLFLNMKNNKPPHTITLVLAAPWVERNSPEVHYE